MAANIFFIYNIIMFNVRTQNIPSAMIDNAVNILNVRGKSGSGFSLAEDSVPAKKPTNYIYEGAYSGDIFKEIVKNFSGLPEDEIKSGNPLPTDNKIKYTAGNYIFIFVNLDYLRVSIMDKSNEKSKEDYRLLAAETETEKAALMKTGVQGVPGSDMKNAKKIIGDFIKKYPVKDVKSDFDIISLYVEYTGNGADYKAVINQKFEGLPINTHIAYVEIKDGAVSYFYGKWYFGSFDTKYTMPLLDSVNILFKCSENDGKSVSGDKLEKMNIEYNVLLPGGGKFYLIPSWSLQFESGKKLSYNMITGNKNIESAN